MRLLIAGEKAEVVSRVDVENIDLPPAESSENLPSTNRTDTQSSTTPEPPVIHENVMRDPDTISVEQAIETYLNGGALDTTNFDRITRLELYGNSAFVILDGYRYGRGYEATTLDYRTVIKVKFFNEYGKVIIEENLTNNSMTDLSALKEMKNLEYLRIEYGNLTTLSGIESLGKIKSLYICKSELSDISPLSELTGLESLYLMDNSISDISPLSNLTGLKTLNLNDNCISDISALSGLTKMGILHLRNNSISDYSPIYALPLTYIEVSGFSEAEIGELQQKFPEAKIIQFE